MTTTTTTAALNPTADTDDVWRCTNPDCRVPLVTERRGQPIPEGHRAHVTNDECTACYRRGQRARQKAPAALRIPNTKCTALTGDCDCPPCSAAAVDREGSPLNIGGRWVLNPRTRTRVWAPYFG